MTDARQVGFEALDGEKCISLTTFRPDGSEARTPVWFTSDDVRQRLFVATGAATGKVQRVLANPHVRVAPCTSRGVVTGPSIEGRARVVDEGLRVRALQREKYGWVGRIVVPAYRLMMRLARRPTGETVYLEIVPRAELAERSRMAAA